MSCRDCVARTDEGEQALFLRPWGVPSRALADGFGRAALCWYRAWLSFGLPPLVGTPLKSADQMPQDVVGDEKLTWLAGAEVGVPTPVGGGGVVGLSGAEQAPSASLAETYGEFVAAATPGFAEYQVRSVCTDGVHAPRAAGRRLCPPLPWVLCYLPALRKITERCRGALRRYVLERAWRVYQAPPTGQFSQRLRRVAEWAGATLDGPVAELVSKAGQPRADFTPASEYPQAARTTNAVERRLNHREIGSGLPWATVTATLRARLAGRAWARQWNLHP